MKTSIELINYGIAENSGREARVDHIKKKEKKTPTTKITL